MKRIVLVRPIGPRNVGSILRVVANFGPAEVALVAPTKPSILVHPDFVQMSHGVENIAEKVRVVRDLSEALADCSGSVGFTARKRGKVELRDWRDAREGICTRAESSDDLLALVFGSEEGGLTREEIEPLQELVRIPTTVEHTSINLAMSVGIVLSSIFFERARSARADSRAPLRGRDREFLKESAKEVLGALARSESARRDIVESIERVFARAPLETRDARAWHLLFRALGSEKTPADFDL